MIINNKEMNFSFSQNRLYKDCPMKYKFRYYDGIKEPSNPNLDLGSNIHKLLELWPKYCGVFEFVKTYEEYLDSQWNWLKYESEAEFNRDKLYFNQYVEAMKSLNDKMTSQYTKKLLFEFIGYSHNDKNLLDQELKLEYDDFIAIVDVVYNYASESYKYVLGDYKVTKHEKTTDSIYDEGQLLIYKYIFCKLNPDIDPDNVEVEYINIKPFLSNQIISTVRYKPSIHDCEVDWNSLQENKAKILSGEFPKRKQWCNWCFYKDMCDEI